MLGTVLEPGESQSSIPKLYSCSATFKEMEIITQDSLVKKLAVPLNLQSARGTFFLLQTETPTPPARSAPVDVDASLPQKRVLQWAHTSTSAGISSLCRGFSPLKYWLQLHAVSLNRTTGFSPVPRVSEIKIHGSTVCVLIVRVGRNASPVQNSVFSASHLGSSGLSVSLPE